MSRPNWAQYMVTYPNYECFSTLGFGYGCDLGGTISFLPDDPL